MHKNFADFFQFMADLSTDASKELDIFPMNKVYSDIYLHILSSTADLVGYNKCTKRMTDHAAQSIFHALR